MSESCKQWLDKWIVPKLRASKSYFVPDATGLIKLDAMENPFSWPESLTHAWLETIKELPLNRYPDPEARLLKAAIREAWALDPKLDLLLGNGSDELIQLLALAFSGSNHTLLTPAPGFVVYSMVAASCHYHFIEVALNSDFSLDLEASLQAIEQHRPALVFIAYPNNPTGNSFDPDAIRQIAAANSGLTVIDEAYFPFADHSFIAEIANMPRTVLLRTFSKMGFAGLRLGVMVGHPELIAQINALRMPYNINTITQASIIFSLQNIEIFAAQMAEIRNERARLFDALGKFPSLTLYPSDANFILVRLQGCSADDVYAKLIEHGILIKNLHAQGGLLSNCLRISVGTPAENTLLLQAFAQILECSS